MALEEDCPILPLVFKATNDKRAPVTTVIIVFLLVVFSFIYVYPLLYMISYSFMSPEDVVDPLVKYIPTHVVLSNYRDALKSLNYWPNLGRSILVSVIPSLLQCGANSLLAYALARFNFKGKKVLFALVLLTFVVPQQVTMIPQVVLLSKLKIIDTIFSFIILSLFGQGIRGLYLSYSFIPSLNKSRNQSKNQRKSMGRMPLQSSLESLYLVPHQPIS